ncbi:MAG TPA: glycosyltransferase [Bacteroidia bacterium]|nr:glycosyltransferase [Bacteroidia bacterium]
MYKILLIGPQPEPITGQSLADAVVAKYLPIYTKNSIDTIDTSLNVLKEDIGKFSLKKTLHYIKQYKELYKIKNSEKVYISMGQTFFGVLKYYPYFLFARLLKKEIIIHIHGNHLWKEYEGLKGLKKKIFFKILSMSDKGIVLSKSLERNLTPFLTKDKIYILENFVEDFLFENLLQKKFDKLRIVYLSNLMQEKGITELLEALQKLNEEDIVFESKIAGGIDEEMKPLIDSYFNKLDKNIKYLGLVYNEEKKELLEWGNVFILPTKFNEGQPISILEAMALGNIILTTKRGGIPDIFKENVNGFYIKKGSSSSIFNKLMELNQNLENYKFISSNNIDEANKKYRVKSFINKLNTILED